MNNEIPNNQDILQQESGENTNEAITQNTVSTPENNEIRTLHESDETPAETNVIAEDVPVCTVCDNNDDNAPALEEDIRFDAEFAPQDTVYEAPVNQNNTGYANAVYAPQEEPVCEQPPQSYGDTGCYAPPTPPAEPPVSGYYYAPPAPMPPAPPAKPKRQKGATALIVCLWVLVGLFSAGFFGLCGYIIGTSTNNTRIEQAATSDDVPTFFPEDDDKDEDKSESPSTEDSVPSNNNSDVVTIPDNNDDLYSDSVSIVLNNIPKDADDTSKYTTQYAYKVVAQSTIGVMCYEKGFSDEPASQGTGIIISKDGYIATNSHVIGDSKSLYYVQVITGDGTTYEAKIIGYDSRTDLAVLKINAKDLTPATFCDSQYVEVGQDVIAVGNPGGIEFQNSLTRGVVSALNRELSLSSQVSYIQTDAAINPGNSGGPLCNMYGQVIGINTAKISSDSYEGMGFAIPSATVKDIVDDLISQGYVQNRVRLGISGTEVNSAMQQYYSIPAGILVGEVSEGGPCDGKGIEKNDIITAIDDEEISTFSEVYAILAKHQPGDKVVLSVYKLEQDKTVEITVTLMADQGETQQ